MIDQDDSDYYDLRQERYEARRARTNQRRAIASQSGEPGDPPIFLCLGCGQEECECAEDLGEAGA